MFDVFRPPRQLPIKRRELQPKLVNGAIREYLKKTYFDESEPVQDKYTCVWNYENETMDAFYKNVKIKF